VAPDDRPRYWHPTSLSGRRAIVTGAAQGVGRGIARALLERGAAVLLVDRNHAVSDVADTLVANGHLAEHLVADLRDRSSYRHIIETAVQRFGGLDALVNNAIATNEPKGSPTSRWTTSTWSSTPGRGLPCS
jgi:NAD(P)-dependent dehydrogenase (short-subunit alcohol dehydrogenase family)